MIPALAASSGALPPGEHAATWQELEATFSTTGWRAYLCRGLADACRILAAAGCQTVWVDGSFVTDKLAPGDFDACWDPVGVDPGLLDPVMLDFKDGRRAQKAAYGGELFPATATADPAGTPFLRFFQVDKTTGDPKGVVVLDPRNVP